MNSDDKVIITSAICAVVMIVGIYATDKWHEQTMKRIENAKNVRAASLQVELEQAKAEQARYRALEIGYLCQFIDKTGEVYLSDGCK